MMREPGGPSSLAAYSDQRTQETLKSAVRRSVANENLPQNNR